MVLKLVPFVYQTGPLDEGQTVVGPIQARLFVSTSGTDSD